MKKKNITIHIKKLNRKIRQREKEVGEVYHNLRLGFRPNWKLIRNYIMTKEEEQPEELTAKKKQRIEKILEYRARGKSLSTIGKIFQRSRERIRQLIKEYKEHPEFEGYAEEIEKTQDFLDRELET